MAPEELCRFDPFVMVLDRRGAACAVRIAEVAFVVAHDEAAADAVVVAALLEFPQVVSVLGFVLEKRVHILDAVDVELTPAR